MAFTLDYDDIVFFSEICNKAAMSLSSVFVVSRGK